LAKISVIIPAAGQGKRMAAGKNKQYIDLFDEPIIVHTLRQFENHPMVNQVILVVGSDEVEFCQKEIVKQYGFTKVKDVIAGGNERQHSVYNGLKILDKDTNIVLIHDGARPLVTEGIITETIFKALELGAVSVAVPSKDTIKVVDRQGYVVATPSRETLWLIQTPQAFRKDIILAAHKQAEEEDYLGTDDASLVERMGRPVKLVYGSYENIKITTPEDLILAQSFLERR
jgi:2-C-methyl-D-erythritol 4-phosphate cytidylyltransferase